MPHCPILSGVLSWFRNEKVSVYRPRLNRGAAMLREGEASRGEKGDTSRFDWMKGASIKRNADGTIELLEKAVVKAPEEVYASEASVCALPSLCCALVTSLGRIMG